MDALAIELSTDLKHREFILNTALNFFMHAGTMFRSIQTVETVVERCVREKRKPTSDEWQQVIMVVESLLSAGLITIPNLSGDEVVKQLEDIKALV